MYAIETKKRKFDRILESIKDHSAPPPNAAKLSDRDQTLSTISLVPHDTSPDSLKRRKISSSDDSPSITPNKSPASQRTASYLPTSREAFLERLETFGPVTKWHIASNEAINASEWAKRGWRCVSTDTVQCPSCKERLLVSLDNSDHVESENPEAVTKSSAGRSPSSVEDDYAMEEEVHAGMVKKYQELIILGHGEACPWRRRGCVDSIQRIEGLLNEHTALLALQTRYDSIVSQPSSSYLPTVMIGIEATEPYAKLVTSLGSYIEGMQPRPATDAYLLAMCGWQSTSDPSSEVIECHHCFRHLGLWLYRGEEPAMQRLDALESHLEYCPWRSHETQATEVQIEGKKVFVPGWVLVAQKIQERYSRRLVNANKDLEVEMTIEQTPSDQDVAGTVPTDEKEREQKMKDLLRRVKELKKPFNVKALLRKKSKPAT